MNRRFVIANSYVSQHREHGIDSLAVKRGAFSWFY